MQLGNGGFPWLLPGCLSQPCPGGLCPAHAVGRGLGGGRAGRVGSGGGSRYLVTSPRFCLLWQLIKIPPGFLPTSWGSETPPAATFVLLRPSSWGLNPPGVRVPAESPKYSQCSLPITFTFSSPELPCSSALPSSKTTLGGIFVLPSPLGAAHKHFGGPPWPVWGCRATSLG